MSDRAVTDQSKAGWSQLLDTSPSQCSFLCMLPTKSHQACHGGCSGLTWNQCPTLHRRCSRPCCVAQSALELPNQWCMCTCTAVANTKLCDALGLVGEALDPHTVAGMGNEQRAWHAPRDDAARHFTDYTSIKNEHLLAPVHFGCLAHVACLGRASHSCQHRRR